MKKPETPTLELLKKGVLNKILQVTGVAGMHMPDHYSTEEAVVIVRKGSALLTMKDKEYMLQRDEPFIIPAGERHSLYLKEDFQAIVIMPVKSTIEF